MTDATSPLTLKTKQRTRFLTWLPFLVAAVLFALGLYTLSRLLHQVHLNEVVAQIRDTAPLTLGLALACTLISYSCLACYDWSALRHIGKKLPTPLALTGGFMAYAFGNTLGLAVISASAVRWKLYSGLGLDGYDIAAISAFTAVAFGTITTLVGLGALTLHPDVLSSVLPISPSTVQLLATAAFFLIAAPLLVASTSGSSVSFGRFTLRAPRPGILGIQAVISLGDMTFAAMTLYLLLPPSDVSFLTFLAIFSAAVMAGVVSHVPGGVGVFEAVILASMPASTAPGQIAAALLLYRLIYYLIPFGVSVAFLALHATWQLARQRDVLVRSGRALQAIEPAIRALSPITPLVLAFTTFGAGLWMASYALLPPLSPAAEAMFPLAFVEGSALITSASGSVLIVLSLGVMERSRAAFWLVIALMGTGAVLMLTQRDFVQFVLLSLFIAVFLPFRQTFSRRALLTHAVLTPTWIMLILAALAGLCFTLFFAHKNTPYANELWWQFAINAHAPRALRSALIAALTLSLCSLFLLLRAPVVRVGPPDSATLAKVADIACSGEDPDAGFALTGDKSILISDDDRAFIMFGYSGRSWIALGGPMGARDAAQEVAFDFVDAARRAGAEPVFYEVGTSDVPTMLELGMTLHKMGEEAVVDLRSFSLEGPHRKRLRNAWSRATRAGLTFELTPPPHSQHLLSELRQISDDWLTASNSHEKGFSVGRFTEAWLANWPLALVLYQGRIVAFANVMTTRVKQRATIDLMRYSSSAPSGTMDFLFTALMLRLKQEGYAEFTMGMAPLSGLAPERSRRLWDRFGALIYRHGGHFYNFSGLRTFKDKFGPEWRPRYLATTSAYLPLVQITDAARLISRKHDGET